MVEDEDLLIEVLNSAPISDGRMDDQPRGTDGRTLLPHHGRTGGPSEVNHVRAMRDCLHATIRETPGARDILGDLLDEVDLAP